MTFVSRDITIQMQLKGDTFALTGEQELAYLQETIASANPSRTAQPNLGDQLELSNLRCRATIQSTIGGATPLQSQMNLQIWGMRESDMAKLSTLGLSATAPHQNRIIVLAGDKVNGMSQVFSGSIFRAYVDYNAMPDVSVEIEASVTLPLQLPRVAGSSFKGSVSVATMLQAIAANCTPPLTFVNKGVTTRLANHATGGSAAAQIADICQAAMCSYDILNGQLIIWPQDAVRDNVEITTSSKTGMVGYPMYTGQGIDIVTEFNPLAQFGRQITVQSSIPKPGPNTPDDLNGKPLQGASGTFYIYDVVHDLSSQLPNGPWFTKIGAGSFPTQAHSS